MFCGQRLLAKKPRSVLIFVWCICFNFIAQSAAIASKLTFDKDFTPTSAVDDLHLGQYYYAFNDKAVNGPSDAASIRVALVIGIAGSSSVCAEAMVGTAAAADLPIEWTLAPKLLD